MPDELQAEVVVPPPVVRRRRIVTPIVCGVLGVAAGGVVARLCMSPEIQTETVVFEPKCEPVVVTVPVATPAVPPAPATNDEVALVLRVNGESYMALETEEIPTFGTPELVADGSARTAIAEVTTKNVPAELRAWKKRTVSVDGSCEAHVTGFAVIGRVEGSARDAQEDLDGWTAATVLELGRPALFARLDGCSGTFARDAAKPAITVLADIEATGDLVERARDWFTSSKLVIDAQTAWREAGNDGSWYEDSDARMVTHVARNPRTGELWVIVHAYRYGDCGQTGGNVVGMYRVDADNKLERVQERDVGFEQIEFLIDLEGDGDLELVGSSPNAVSIERANGESVRSLSVASYGCGC